MRFSRLVSALLLLISTRSALAISIIDITEFVPLPQDVFSGTGIVTGLPGTGDGPADLKAAQEMKSKLTRLGLATDDLDLGNPSTFALVKFTVTIPENGGCIGHHLDVHLQRTGHARSLTGGRLYLTPLTRGDGNDPSTWLALLTGAVNTPDTGSPTTGLVKSGATLNANVPRRYLDDSSHFTLMINDRCGTPINTRHVADAINLAAADKAAVVTGPQTIQVQIPPKERWAPDAFINRMLLLDVTFSPVHSQKPPAGTPNR